MLSFGLSWALSYFCATVWPTYASFKALATSHSVDDTQWLTYWVVYSVLTTVEALAASFVTWFPFYYELRLLFVLWLILPQTKGAQLFFETYIKPTMKKYGASIEPAFQRAEQIMNSQQVHQIVSLSEKYGPQIAQQALTKAAEEAQRLAGNQSGGQSANFTSQKVQPNPNQGYQQNPVVSGKTSGYSQQPQTQAGPPGYNQPHRY